MSACPENRKRKTTLKTKRFGLLLVPAVSAAMLALGCESHPDPRAGSRVCVDAYGRRVPDSECDDRNPSYHTNHFYHWYVISHGASVPVLGGTAPGAALSPSTGFHSVSGPSHRSGIHRGGFGSSARGSSRAGG
jgi:hypothetical protein